MDALGRRSQDALTFAPLAAALAIGAFLRFDALGEASFWLDEVLDAHFAQEALRHPWWHWITGFGREHGPLYFALQLLARLFGDGEAAGRFPAALFGLLTIAVVWLAARVVDARGVTANVCALLVATSPFHVYYSREARPYALLMLLAAALLLALLRGARPIVIGALCLIALYTSAIAAGLVAAVAVAAACMRQWRIAITAGVVAALFPLLYRADPAGTGAVVPEFDWSLILRAFTVSATGADHHGRTVAALFLFAVVGAVALVAAIATLAMALLPIAIAIAALFLKQHFFALRYLSPALPAFLLLVAVGIARLGSLIALAICAVTIAQTWETARLESFQKLDWRRIAAVLETYARPGDVILTSEPSADVTLRHYLRRLRPGVRVVSVPHVPIAEILTKTSPAVWMVTVYNAPDLSMRYWMCRFPLLMASPLEGFRLHYAPSAKHFLRERAGPPEMRAWGTADLLLRAGTNDELFLGDGWAAADVVDGRTYRWVIAKTASLSIPRWGRRDRTIRIHALAAAPQTTRVLLNGVVIGETLIGTDWSDYTFAAPAALWRDGMNDVSFTFDRLDRAPNDPRTLAALFDTIAVGEKGTLLLPPLRIAADPFLDAGSLWRGRSKRPLTDLGRPAVEALLLRLGFDPAAGSAAIARGDVEVNDVVRTIAWGPDCEDDRTFLTRAFATLLQRAPNPIEERDLLGRLERGARRDAIVARILNAM